MIEKFRGLTNRKSFHIVMIIIIIAVILFTLGIIILKYNVEGEKNMPFTLSKISIISSSEGIDKQPVDTKWLFDLYQANDIYLYIDKNNNYSRTEAIKSININNFEIEAKTYDNIKLYKPDSGEEKVVFKNKDENIVNDLEYLGDVESNLKQLKISNQGGIIAFRCSNNNLAEYSSNEDVINHNELLRNAGITKEKLNIKLTFNLTIVLEEGKEYQSTIQLDLPAEEIIEKGISYKEITDTSDFIFKRIKN